MIFFQVSINPLLDVGVSLPGKSHLVEQWRLLGIYSGSNYDDSSNHTGCWELDASHVLNNSTFQLNENNYTVNGGMKILDSEIESDFESSIDDDEESFESLAMEELNSSNPEVDEINMDCKDDIGKNLKFSFKPLAI